MAITTALPGDSVPPRSARRSIRGQASVETACLLATLLSIAGAAAGAVRHSRTADGAVRAVVTAQSAPAAPVVVSAGDAAAGLWPAPTGGPLAVAQALLARRISEQPPGSDWSPEIAIFTDGNREPWCADFVSYVLREGGRPLTGGASGGWRLAAAADVRRWFVAENRWRSRAVASPAPGDVVSFAWGHVGIVEEATADLLVTIEGNSADALNRRTRRGWRADLAIEGFGRP
jgi:hypothetical protein